MLRDVVGKILELFIPKDHMDTAEETRIRTVLPHVKGRLLDVGCGFNNLVRMYKGDGVGVDVCGWGDKPDLVVKRTDSLPYKNCSFDTITYLAAINHIPYRLSALKEAKRVLKQKGRIIITMIGPKVGKVAHFGHGKDEKLRGFKHNEKLGMTDEELKILFAKAGFAIDNHLKFSFGFNNVYILKKPEGNLTAARRRGVLHTPGSSRKKPTVR